MAMCSISGHHLKSSSERKVIIKNLRNIDTILGVTLLLIKVEIIARNIAKEYHLN